MYKKIIFGLTMIGYCSTYSCKTTANVQHTGASNTIEQLMVKALTWQEANPISIKGPADWTNGAYYTGVARAHQATNSKMFLDALEAMGKRNNWQPGDRFFSADDVPIGYAYTYLKSIGNKEVNLAPTEQFINDHLYKPHKWKDGPAEKEQVILWWWCDALFMAPPVITSFAKLKKDNSYLEAMDKFYKQTYDLLYDKDEHLFARDNRFLLTGEATDKKEANGKKIFWSRGNGWVLGGLALILDDMPKDYKNRKFYEDLFKEMASKIKEIQPGDGLWRTSLLSPESFNHGEVSGTGFFTFALAWGINNGILSKDIYEPAVLKAWAAMEQCQQQDGKVGWVQKIGADPRSASPDSWQNYGTGAFLLAGSEVLKLVKK